MTVQSRDERERALTLTIEGLEKRFGKGALMRLGEASSRQIESVSSGCLSLNIALGTGGYPKGRVIEVYGPEASGKTTLALHAIAEVQKSGGVAAFVDAEHALDASYAEKLGVNLNALLIAQPDSGEQALEITESLVRSGAVDLVVVDSVAALVPQAELEGDMGDAHMGLQARLMSQALRKLTGVTGKTGTMVLFINQVRHKIGVVFGNGEVTTGGNALKFYSSVRIEVRRIGAIKEGTEIVGANTRIRVIKNKLAPPFKTCEVEIRYGEGICPASDLLALGEVHGLVHRKGSWYTFGDTKLGQGKNAARTALNAHPDWKEALYQAVLCAVGHVAKADA